jgi:hypothetical protein
LDVVTWGKGGGGVGLVQQMKDMCNVFPKSRIPQFFSNNELELEVMERVLR